MTRPPRPQPRAILFDLDGTLDDRPRSIAKYADRFSEAFAGRLPETANLDLVAALQSADGDGYRPRAAVCEDLQRRLPWRSAPTIQHLVEHWNTWFPASSAPRDGLLSVVQALRAREILLAVVTNGGTRIQQSKIQSLGVAQYLSAVVISESVRLVKPDPRIFAYALSELRCSAAEAWFVGDHPVNDVLGTEATGIHAIWLPALVPWPSEQPEPSSQISSLTDLLTLIDLPSA